MNEFERAFNEDVREKKALVPSARKRKRGSKSKACSVPSDYLTKAELNKMNGPVNTYNIAKPMSWDQFIEMPKDLQERHLQYIGQKFAVGACVISTIVFGCHYTTLPAYCRRHRLNLDLPRTKPSQDVKKALADWVNGIEDDPTEIDTSEEKTTEDFVEENLAKEIPSEEAAAEQDIRFPLKMAALTMSGEPEELLQAMRLFLCGRAADVEITINFK